MKHRILICDDASFMRSLLKDIILRNGYEVCGEAVNGNDAVEKYKQLKPDLVTMDIVMPEKNGIEALKEIMLLDGDAKIVMCSALGQETLVMEAIESGAKEFVIKPFSEEVVANVLNKVLKSEI